MKKVLQLLVVAIGILSLSSCGTIVGGSKYYAKVKVENNRDAKIYYKGSYKGAGEASFKVKRRDADEFSVTIKEEGKEDYIASYTEKSFRGWAFVGSLMWTGLTTGGIPLPWGLAVDIPTGALWKPDISEKGVDKEDMKHFVYNVQLPESKKVEVKPELEASKETKEVKKSE